MTKRFSFLSRTFMFLGWILILTKVLTEGKVCPGFCVPPELCTSDGRGKIIGYCVNQRACCDVTQKLNHSTCGTTVNWENKAVHFFSPNYPRYSSGSLICPFEIKLDQNAKGVKLEFDMFELDQKIFDGGTMKKCDGDLMLLKGFSNWMTDPRCGDLTGYSILMEIEKNEYPEKKVTILFILSSKRYRWNIRIQQILTKKLRKSELCLENRMRIWEKSPNFLKQLNISSHPTLFPSLTPMTLSKSNWVWEGRIFMKIDFPTEQKSETFDYYNNNNNNYSCPQNESIKFNNLCLGTIIDDRHIILAASCFLNQPSVKKLKIVVGGADGVWGSSSGCSNLSEYLLSNIYDVESVSIHFNFISSMRANDLAILRTKKSITFSKTVQPLKLVEENSLLFDKLFFSSVQQQQQGQNVKNVHAIVPENAHHCSLALTSKLQLTRRSLKELEESNKYHGLLQHWICFDILNRSDPSTIQNNVGKPMTPNMNGKDDHLHQQLLLLGSPLLSSTMSGEDFRLIGIFNYFIPRHVPQHQHHQYHYQQEFNTFQSRQNLFKNNNNETRYTTIYCPKSLGYFTNLAFYRRWILMAMS